jgi:uncharacterized protein (TIGR02145 family)
MFNLVYDNRNITFGDANVGYFTEADEVTIGDQVWKIHNLAINDNGGGITIVNGEYYYTQDAAIRVAATVTGWHLPSTEEFDTLITNAGGFNGLAAAESWTYGGGDNSSGFGALAKGSIVAFVDPNNPRSVGIHATYWSSNTSNKYSMELYHTSDSAGSVDVMRHGASSASVRLIKD